VRDFLFPDPYWQTWAVIVQARHTLHETLKRAMEPLGISPRQAAVILIIEGIDGPATPAEISRWLNRERPSVSVLLDRMKKKGLIEKTMDLDKKNMIRVTLTEKGKEAHALLKETKIFNPIFSVLSDEQLQQLKLCLTTLSERALELTSKHK